MDQDVIEINKILDHLSKHRWISFKIDEPSIRLRAKDILRADGLIERNDNKLSWRLTTKGYEAIRLGGYGVWKKTNSPKTKFQKIGEYLVENFVWCILAPIGVGIILLNIEYSNEYAGHEDEIQNKDSFIIKEEKKQPFFEANSNITKSELIRIYSFEAVELDQGNLIISVRNLIEVTNQNIDLKIVQKKPFKEAIFKQQSIGDVIIFNNYVITLNSIERNPTYELVLKVEKTK